MNALSGALLSVSLLAALPVSDQAAGAEQDKIADTYARPAELIRIPDGRALNLRCSGAGEQVVMLEAGGNADAGTWFRVQPRLAGLAKVCAYDRAGYGFSDEGPQPRDLDADVADFHALMKAADIRPPVILVGHSLGGNIVRKYAQRYPHHVAGMVLVDPPEQGADDQMPEVWRAQIASGLAQREAFLGACEDAAVSGDSEAMQRCLREPPLWMGERVASAMQRNKAKPSYWRTLRSELAHNIEVFSRPVPAEESYGDIPLVLLHASAQDDDVPDDVRKVIEAARGQTHARILAGSTRGIAVAVPNSSHDIHLDQPEAVVSAVRKLLRNEAAGR